ncbi:DUF3618 domain-containing protein [Streptomyces sp. NPDC057445]|uniref:DUF3618 domain-containing protein n=1 Tax=Streptomyces sp. NPDC057445 TaxID=3346136 RepID=UPI0036B0260E
MTDRTRRNGSTPTPDELREEVQGTREQLGRTVEALAAKTDVKAQVQEKVTAAKGSIQDKAVHAKEQVRDKKEQVRDKAVHAKEQVHDKAVHAKEQVHDKAVHAKEQVAHTAAGLGGQVTAHTPDPVLRQAGKARGAVRRKPLLFAVPAVAVVCWVVYRVRRGR